jgi:hypothetical protein
MQNEIKLKTTQINELLNSIETKNCQIEELKTQINNESHNYSNNEEKEIQFVERLQAKDELHNNQMQKLTNIIED